MATSMTATVFGASGFIGRYIVKKLADRGYVVRAAMRDIEGGQFLRPLGKVGQIVPLYAPFGNEAAMRRAVEGADCVFNAVGILAEGRRGDFDRVHHQGPAMMAKLAREAGVRTLVHISAIGADASSPSAYGRSKAAGEAAVRAAFPAAVILRPSIVFGAEDQFFNRFGRMAVLSPALPVIEGDTRFQPVYVGDVADAAMATLDHAESSGGLYELGGPEIATFRELLAYILEVTGRQRTLMPVPRWLATVQGAVLQNLPGKMLTRDQVVLLRSDNVVAADARTLQNLDIAPTPFRLVVPGYLRRYRPGGHKVTPDTM